MGFWGEVGGFFVRVFFCDFGVFVCLFVFKRTLILLCCYVREQG